MVKEVVGANELEEVDESSDKNNEESWRESETENRYFYEREYRSASRRIRRLGM